MIVVIAIDALAEEDLPDAVNVIEKKQGQEVQWDAQVQQVQGGQWDVPVQ